MNEFSLINRENSTDEGKSEQAASSNQTTGLVELPANTFEHDLAVSDRFQHFSGELLRLSLIGIGAVGFLLFNVVFAALGDDKNAQAADIAKRTFQNADFRFYVYSTLWLFGISAGLALLHRYFGMDAKAYHLKYIRLRHKFKDLEPETNAKSQRNWFEKFTLYLFGAPKSDYIKDKIENEKDASDWLFSVSRWLLFLSGFSLWLGAMSLILAFRLIFPAT